jgi:hypothetical protein
VTVVFLVVLVLADASAAVMDAVALISQQYIFQYQEH